MKLRWDPYFMKQHYGFSDFWKEHLKEDRSVLLISGLGFDPRMCTGLEEILASGGRGVRDVYVLEMDEGESSPTRKLMELAEANMQKLRASHAGRGELHKETVAMWSTGGHARRRTTSRCAANAMPAAEELRKYTDIVVDISALPRSAYFPLVSVLLHNLEQRAPRGRGRRPNLHVVVAENPEIDAQIREVGVDDAANYVFGYGAEMELDAVNQVPIVWLALVGEGQGVQLERIDDLVQPHEICPVLPSPSLDPRRADKLLFELQDLLFERFRVEPGNFIFACEHNPFEAYRQILRTVEHYENALAPLGKCRIAISALSSKLLSVGALLAAYELKTSGRTVGLANVESLGYEVGNITEEMVSKSKLYSLWLAGECYE